MLICGVRDYTIGIDTESYVAKYRNGGNEYTSEPLFDITYSIIRFFDGTWHLWLLFVTIILYTPYIIAIEKYSQAPVFSALIFLVSPCLFFFDSMNGMRQWISGGFVLLAFLYRNEHRFKRTVLCLFIAIGFHLSSIVAIPFMFVRNKTIPFFFVIILLVVTSVTCIALSHLNLNSVFEQYSILLESFDGDTASKFSKYSQYGDLENTTNWKYYLFNIFPLNLLCFASYPSSKLITKSPYKENENGYLFNVFFIGTILMNICAISIKYGHRIFFVIMTLQLILLPKQLIRGSKNQKGFIYFLSGYMVLWYIYYIV